MCANPPSSSAALRHSAISLGPIKHIRTGTFVRLVQQIHPICYTLFSQAIQLKTHTHKKNPFIYKREVTDEKGQDMCAGAV